MRSIKRSIWLILWASYALSFFTLTVPIAILGRLKRFSDKSNLKSHTRVSLGIHEIAGNLRDLESLLRTNHVDTRRAKDVTIRIHKFYGDLSHNKTVDRAAYLRDYLLNRFLNIFDLWDGLLRSSHFYFVWKTSYLPFNLDYPLIRLSGARLIIQHCGDDVRFRRLHDAIFDKYCPGIKSGPYEDNSSFGLLTKLIRQFWAECFGLVITMRNQATFQFGHCIHFFFVQQLLCSTPRKPNKTPVIVHAPSDRLVKRTDVVIGAVEILKRERLGFTFNLLENVNNQVVIQALKEADVVVDQPATWPARFAIEGCAASCCVISGNCSDLIGRSSNPVLKFETDPHELAAVLRTLLIDEKLLEKKMRECWEFWRDYYSPLAVWEILSSVLEGCGNSFPPLKDQKELLLSRCHSGFEKIIVKWLYRPISSP